MRQLATTLLIVLALAAAQVITASPLHNHLVHVADCTLCHHDGSQSVPVTPCHVARPAQESFVTAPATGRAQAESPRHFLARAPPCPVV